MSIIAPLINPIAAAKIRVTSFLGDKAFTRVVRGRRASNVARRSLGGACDHLTVTGDVYGQTSDDAIHAAIAGLTGALGH